MNNLTRRNLLAGAAGATAATVLPFEIPVKAATPPAGKQAPGWYRYKIGTIEITVATDGVARFKMAEDHVTNIKLDAVNAALAEVFMEKDMMTTPYNPIAVNTGSKLAVIDTGTGESNYKKSGGVGGQFITNLSSAGIDRGAVDTVIISHYHGDHINGLLMDAFYDQDGPKAEATRRKVYDMLVVEKLRVQGFHYPFPSLAHVEKYGTGYREIPVIWNPTI